MTQTNFQLIKDYIYEKTTVIDVIDTHFDKTLILDIQDDIQASIVLWNNDVVECRIESKKNHYYYLHFDNNNYQRSKELIDDFFIYKHDFYNKKAKHILICCSSGFTSSLLVEGVNRIIHEMNYPMTVEFGSCFKLDADDNIYDLILLAPQIAHMEQQINEICKTKSIPTNIYGASNYHTLLNYIFLNIE